MSQAHDTALLLAGWSTIAARAGADGVHVAGGADAVDRRLRAFKPERIVGVGAIRSRHDAMSLAETGVDYVMFGEPRAMVARRRSIASSSGRTGGPSSSRSPVSPMPRTSAQCSSWPMPGPISLRLAMPSGDTTRVRPKPLRWRAASSSSGTAR